MLGYRSNDAVLTVCQNNKAKSIEIVDLNSEAVTLVGYENAELVGRKLMPMLPERLAELLSEYVEYEENANDLGAVLSKLQNFSLKGKNHSEKTFRLKVVRGESTKEKLIFRLVLQDTMHSRKDDALRRMMQDNFKGHEVLHPAMGVPNRHSLEKDVELAIYYHRKTEIRASFVAVQVDHMKALFQQYGAEQCAGLLKHVAHVCRSNLRPSDVVGAASDTQLGILLLDAVADATRMVANRMRWQVAAQPYTLPDNSLLSVSVSMVYMDIDGTLSAEQLVDSCVDPLTALPDDAASQLLDAKAS